MSKLQELINELCPGGVEWKKIKDCYTRLKGTPITASQMKQIASEDGDVKIIAGGKTVVYAREKDIPKANIIRRPALVVQSRGIIDVMYCDEPFTFKNEMWAYTSEEIISIRFLYYYLKQNINVLRDKASGMGSLPQISLSATEDLLIPIPPLPVQEEIVRILDSFTNLAAELQAELQARKEQYEFYRNKLLSFNNLGGGIQVEWKKMSEIGTFYGGLSGKTKEDFNNGNAKFITYMNVYSNIALKTDVDDKVYIAEGEKQNAIQYGDALFTGSSETPDECGMSSVLTSEPQEPLYLNSFCFGFRLNDKKIYHPDFLKHLLRSRSVRNQIGKTANGVTRFNVSKKLMAKVTLPIPPLAEQKRIAEILDRFEALTTDLSEGLPAEIAAVQEQYEYYRNKLLDFREIKSNSIS